MTKEQWTTYVSAAWLSGTSLTHLFKYLESQYVYVSDLQIVQAIEVYSKLNSRMIEVASITKYNGA